MPTLLRRSALALAAAASLASCNQDDEIVSQTLLGTWALISYEEAGIAGTVSGTAEFRSNGSVDLAYSLTLPGEPTLVVLSSGTWDQNGNNVNLTLEGVSYSYTVEFSGDVAILRQFGGAGIIYGLQRA